MSASDVKRCSRCILPENYPDVNFDAQGECSYCRAYQKIAYLGSSRLREDLAKHRRTGGEHDCLVPVSGGKDSAFVLLQMTRVYGMRVLAFHYDNCLIHDVARENLRQLTDALGVELITKRNERQKQHLGINLRAYVRSPSLGMVPMLCTGCRYGIVGNAFKLARQKNIPMVVIGWSPIEDTPFKEAYLKGGGKSVLRGLLRNLLKNPAYVRWGNMVAAARDYCHSYSHVRGNSFLLRLMYPGVKLIQFYDYVPYAPGQIQETVQRELNWRAPKEQDSWQFDCRVKLIQDYLYRQEVGFTAADGYLSAMVREGLLTRCEALERLECCRKDGEEAINRLQKFLADANLRDMIYRFS